MNTYLITYRKDGQREVLSRRIVADNAVDAITIVKRIVEKGGNEMVFKDIQTLGSKPRELTSSSLTMHNLVYLRYTIEGKGNDPDMAPYTDTTSRLTSIKQARIQKLLQNSLPPRRRH